LTSDDLTREHGAIGSDVAEVDRKRYVLRGMATQKRKRQSKRAGETTGDAFRQRLRLLIQEAGSKRAFARKLWEDVQYRSDRTPRIVEWERGRSFPGYDSLRLIAEKLDVSIDWLMGFPVPRRLSARKPVGELARAVRNHVARQYNRHTHRDRRDGLAFAMGGSLADGDAPRPKKRGDPWPPMPKVGDELPDGRIVTHCGPLTLRVLDVDPHRFLERICDRVFAEAEAWEDANKESERELVRNDIRALLRDAEPVAQMLGRTRENLLEELLAASLDPLDRKAQAGVYVAREAWRGEKARRENWDNAIAEIVKNAVAETTAKPG